MQQFLNGNTPLSSIVYELELLACKRVAQKARRDARFAKLKTIFSAFFAGSDLIKKGTYLAGAFLKALSDSINAETRNLNNSILYTSHGLEPNNLHEL